MTEQTLRTQQQEVLYNTTSEAVIRTASEETMYHAIPDIHSALFMQEVMYNTTSDVMLRNNVIEVMFTVSPRPPHRRPLYLSE